MLEVAGGILLAIGALVLGAIIVGNFRALGFAICALGLIVLIAWGVA